MRGAPISSHVQPKLHGEPHQETQEEPSCDKSPDEQEAHVEQVAHSNASRMAFTVAVVMRSVSAGATSTGRPNFPDASLAR